MRRPIAPPPSRELPRWPLLAAWTALFLLLALVPDEKISRLKLWWSEAALCAAALAALWAALRSESAWARTPLDLPVALYGASGLLFFALCAQPAAAAPELCRVLGCAAAFFAASQAAARLEGQPLPLAVWAGAAGLVGLYAGFQRLGGLGPLAAPAVERPAGTFGNPVLLGEFLAASAAATAALAARPMGRAWRAAAAAALAGQLLGLWLSQSRGACAGLAAALCLWVWLCLEEPWRAPAFSGLCALGALACWSFRGRAWTHWLLWEGALKLWLAHPWLGCGLGRFHLEFPAYEPAALRLLWPPGAEIVNFAHNEYLQALAETGPLGALALLAVPAALLWTMARRPSKAAAPPALAAAALFAGAAVSPGMRFGVSSLLAFGALGFAAGTGWAEKLAWPPRAAAARAGAAAAALTFLAAWSRLAAEPYLAERRLTSAPAFDVAAAAAAPEQERLEAQAARAPGDADAQERLGYLYARERRWSLAAARFKQAARLSPGQAGPLNNLGNVYYALGDKARAEACWRRAERAAPGQPDAHLNLGQLLFERGRLKEAAGELQTALRLDPGNAKARVLLKRMTE